MELNHRHLALTICDHHPRLANKFIALDFSEDLNTVASKMKADCNQVSFVLCLFGWLDELNAVNEALYENFLCALIQVAPELENVTLQTRGK
jgi:hypothetical protein